MEISPGGQAPGARIERAVRNAVADGTPDGKCTVRCVQVPATFNHPTPVT